MTARPKTNALAAKIEVAASRVADLDRQIGQIDAAVAAATQRSRTNAAVSVMEGQRKARAGLAGEREKAADASCGRTQDRTRHGGCPGPADRDRSGAHPACGRTSRGWHGLGAGDTLAHCPDGAVL
jgi:hypothetical protein